MKHPILVAGAGPGGLVAAAALRRVGIPVVVLERAPEVRAAGAGLTLQTNAMRMLEPLGLADAVANEGERLRSGRIETDAGEPLSSLPMEDAETRWGAPGVAIHRAALARVLSSALPPDTIRCDATVASFEHDEEAVHVELSDGSAIEGAALIGADGIHSRVRAGLFGERPLRYAGYTCWRGIAPLARPLGEGVSVERWGRGRRFGIVPISATETYWFATENAPEGGEDGADVSAEMRARFSDFADPVAALIEATPAEAILRNDIIDLALLPTWTRGRVALLGDAAHAMTPNMGQGACQAIEDAVVLASELARAPSVPEGLARYEARRIERARFFVSRSWTLGRAAQWENGAARAVRDALTRMTPRSVLEKTMDRAWRVEVPPLA